MENFQAIQCRKVNHKRSHITELSILKNIELVNQSMRQNFDHQLLWCIFSYKTTEVVVTNHPKYYKSLELQPSVTQDNMLLRTTMVADFRRSNTKILVKMYNEEMVKSI